MVLTLGPSWYQAGLLPQPDSVPKPDAEQGCYSNPAIPLWLKASFVQLTHGMLLKGLS